MKVEPPEPTALVIFGASGDLTSRKLLPAVYHLFHEGMLPGSFAVVGVARTEMTDDAFRDHAREAIGQHGRCEVHDEMWDEFAPALTYRATDLAQPGALDHLRRHLEDLDRTRGTEGRRLFYLSTPPEAYRDIVRRLAESGLNEGSRVVIEKPYGTDLEDMRDLDRAVHDVFDEPRIFRIDHYLGKETVQNVLALRFANSFFEPLWNHRYVDHVQLTVAEDIGIEGRGSFYERTGALKDMVQTHLFQVLTFLAMEPPPAFDPERLRDEKVKVLRAMRPVRPEDVVLGQYQGYRDERNVAPDSRVNTFVAMRVEIDNWRWAGVPFFLRTGKRLARKQAEATVVFKEVPHLIFEQLGMGPVDPNRLSIRFQPDEGLSMAFTVQKPGLGLQLEPASLDFDYGTAFDTPLVEAYELLLLEAMRGDPTLFTRSEGVERAWEVLQPLLEDLPDVHTYERGSWGPQAADELIAPRRWWMCPRGSRSPHTAGGD
ncbi:MAG TPA: glucose-6-phosphate dehydrogenase [Actinomycetota bacterium]|jgi:glucose-6-phosphate 1-dehydrogenase